MCKSILLFSCLAGACYSDRVETEVVELQQLPVAGLPKTFNVKSHSNLQPCDSETCNALKFAKLLLGFHPRAAFHSFGAVARSPTLGRSLLSNRQSRCEHHVMFLSNQEWQVSKVRGLDMKAEDTIAEMMCDIDPKGLFYFQPLAKFAKKDILSRLPGVLAEDTYYANVAQKGKEVVAFGGVQLSTGYPFPWIKEDIPVISNLVVKEEFRRCGIGKALLQDLEDKVVRDWNFGRVYVAVVSSNEVAREVYEKKGYGDAVEENGVVLLSKRLNIFRYALAVLRGALPMAAISA